MYLPRRFGRGRISAVAAAAVVIATPAAIAVVPDAVSSVLGAVAGPPAAKAPSGAEAGAPAPGTPMKSGLLRLDLGPALGPAGNGVAAAPVDGAVQLGANGVGLKARAGGRIAHGGGKLLGGKVVFDGGVRLSKGDRAVVMVKDFAVDLKTHVVTAKVGDGKPDARFGVLDEVSRRLLPRTEPGDANIAMGGRLVLDAKAGARINAGLGAEVFGGAGTGGAGAASGAGAVAAAGPGAAGAGIGATVEFGADLDVDLAFALGLDAELGLEPRPTGSRPDPDIPPTPLN